jgi:fructokinase
MTLALGSDLGGTKIEIIALAESGEVLVRSRRRRPQGSYADTLNVIGALMHEAEA